MKKPGTAIIWHRKDLRLDDNPALVHAAKYDAILPIYIYDETSTMGGASKWWLHHSLAKLADAYRDQGGKLNLFVGKPSDILEKIAKEIQPKAIFWNRCYEPTSTERDRLLKSKLAQNTLVETFNASLIAEPWEILKKDGKPYQVYTPYWNAFLAFPKKLECLEQPAMSLAKEFKKSLSLESLNLLPKIRWDSGLRQNWTPGEQQARKTLEEFLAEPVRHYDKSRDNPSSSGTSRLSPHLAFGEISPRRIWQFTNAKSGSWNSAKNEGIRQFLREIVWREFSYYLLYHFPFLTKQPLRPAFKNFPWQYNRKLLEAWQSGLTGYPIVDAGIRQLWQTGWMHNRVRMIAASFLVKHLLIHWHEGAEWFWDTLVDADLANNTAGWQWVAGSGADAAPYFRIFNPMTQGEKFDAQGLYVKRWIPELKNLAPKWIHKPFEAPSSELKKAGVILGKNYPLPIVDHVMARKIALEAYSIAKKGIV